MPWIRSIGTAVPGYLIEQNDAREFAGRHFVRGRPDCERLLRVFDNVHVRRRFSCVPMEWFRSEHTFAERNDLFLKEAEQISTRAVQACLKNAELRAEAVDHIVFLSSTGISTPSLDARLVRGLGLKPSVRRTPVFGLGCAGGGAGLSLCEMLVRGNPRQTVLLVTVELSTLTFQPADFSKSNVVACSLFSDGAAAVLIEGDEVASQSSRVELLASRSITLANTLDVMGWRFGQSGMSVVFSKSIPALVKQHFLSEVEAFLGQQCQSLKTLDYFVLHPGGAKILEVYQETLSVSAEQLEHSRFVLENYGNMSAPTVLFILKRLLDSQPPAGTGLLAAFGPGFSTEMSLFRIAE